MSDQNTWIDQPRQQKPEDDSLPQMPPPPPPPGSEGPNWKLFGTIAAVLIVVICLVGGGFVAWNYFQGNDLGFLPSASDASDDVEDTSEPVVPTATEEIATPEPTDPPPTAVPPTDTQAPTEIPTETLTPTPAIPTYLASQPIFCRLGPSSIYGESRTMNEGDELPILGQSVSPVDGLSVWYLVEIDGRRCYVSSGFGTVSGDESLIETLPAPPTPTNTPTQTPTLTPTVTNTPTQ